MNAPGIRGVQICHGAAGGCRFQDKRHVLLRVCPRSRGLAFWLAAGDTEIRGWLGSWRHFSKLRFWSLLGSFSPNHDVQQHNCSKAQQPATVQLLPATVQLLPASRLVSPGYFHAWPFEPFSRPGSHRIPRRNRSFSFRPCFSTRRHSSTSSTPPTVHDFSFSGLPAIIPTDLTSRVGDSGAIPPS